MHSWMISSSSRSSSKVYPSLSSTDSTCVTTDVHQSVQPASNLFDLHKQCICERTPLLQHALTEVPSYPDDSARPDFIESPRCHLQSSKQSIRAYAAQSLPWPYQLSNTSNTISPQRLLRFPDPYAIKRATVLSVYSGDAQCSELGKQPSTCTKARRFNKQQSVNVRQDNRRCAFLTCN